MRLDDLQREELIACVGDCPSRCQTLNDQYYLLIVALTRVLISKNLFEKQIAIKLEERASTWDSISIYVSF